MSKTLSKLLNLGSIGENDLLRDTMKEGLNLNLEGYVEEIDAFVETISDRIEREVKAAIKSMASSQVGSRLHVAVTTDEEVVGIVDIVDKWLLVPDKDNPKNIAVAAFEAGWVVTDVKTFMNEFANKLIQVHGGADFGSKLVSPEDAHDVVVPKGTPVVHPHDIN